MTDSVLITETPSVATIVTESDIQVSIINIPESPVNVINNVDSQEVAKIITEPNIVIETLITEVKEGLAIVNTPEPMLQIIKCVESGPQGKPGEPGRPGIDGAGGGYNFMETTPAVDTATNATSITITGRTMRRSGVDEQTPIVMVNNTPVTVMQDANDKTVYTFSYFANLSIGANQFIITSDNGTSLTKNLTITRNGIAPSCSLSHSTYFKAGLYVIQLLTDYPLIAPPTLGASIGSLSAFTGGGTSWTAILSITDQNGNGVFSYAILPGDGGTGTLINSGSTYVVDTVAPVIGASNFSRTLWNYENGSMNCTIAMGENTAGFTGLMDLSAFGLSSSYTLTPSGNNMIANFTPSRVDTPPTTGKNIRVFDRCGNAATPKAETDNQLQVIAYRLAFQKLLFAPYSATSDQLSGGKIFTNDANSIVSWGTGQTNTGRIYHGTDYTVTTHNKIVLDGVKWANTIAANALGLLNVDVYEN